MTDREQHSVDDRGVARRAPIIEPSRAGLFVSREPRTPRVTCAYTTKFLTQPDLFKTEEAT